MSEHGTNGDRGYYGRPVLKAPVWKPQIPFYFFTGGLGGASAVLALAARATGRSRLARASSLVGLAADVVSPLLLITDLGRPERFHHMLRMLRVTSPMSVGSWVLAGEGAASGAAVALDLTGRLPRVRTAAEVASAVLGPPLATYTAVLVANTAVPVWHEARRELPFVFAASSAASAGAAALPFVPPEEAGPARRAIVAGVVGELVATEAMKRRLGELAGPYRSGRAARLDRAASALSVGGAVVTTALGRRSRVAASAGGALVLGGAMLRRWSVFVAGRESALDPAATIGPQRARLEGREATRA
ncbi:MAG: NrfD/PsrC family molybdoenzyme membrane anchor subunit [Thermoleophilia bacterium]